MSQVSLTRAENNNSSNIRDDLLTMPHPESPILHNYTIKTQTATLGNTKGLKTNYQSSEDLRPWVKQLTGSKDQGQLTTIMDQKFEGDNSVSKDLNSLASIKVKRSDGRPARHIA